MAQYQRTSPNSIKTCRIIGTETVETHTVYIIEVRIGKYRWTVRHRYNDFYELNFKLTSKYRSLDKDLLPKKKVFGNQSEQLIHRRQVELEVYLDQLLIQLPTVPSFLSKFLEFNRYEVRGISQSLAEALFVRGDVLLRKGTTFIVSPLQLHALCVRLKLAEPPCDSVDARKDLSHAVDFFSQARDLKIEGSGIPIGSSNINMNELTFDLHICKSLHKLHINGCNVDVITDVTSTKKSLKHLEVHNSLTDIKDVILIGLDCIDCPSRITADVIREHGWKELTLLDLSVNHITTIDESIRLASGVHCLDLSYNQIQTIENLESLSYLRVLVLNNNNMTKLPDLHTRLGNITTLQLRNNKLESLAGLFKMYSLAELDIRGNNIKEISAMQKIGGLPVLTSLHTESNPVHDIVDYRLHVFQCFEQRANEVSLDGRPASGAELDAIAVRLALKKSADIKSQQTARKAPIREAVIIGTSDGDSSAVASSSSVAGHPSSAAQPTCISAEPSGATSSLSSTASESEYNRITTTRHLNLAAKSSSMASVSNSTRAVASDLITVGITDELVASLSVTTEDLSQCQTTAQSDVVTKSELGSELGEYVGEKAPQVASSVDVKFDDVRPYELESVGSEGISHTPDILQHFNTTSGGTVKASDTMQEQAAVTGLDDEHHVRNEVKSIHLSDSSHTDCAVTVKAAAAEDRCSSDPGSSLLDVLDDSYEPVRCVTDSRSSDESDTQTHDSTADTSIHSDSADNISVHRIDEMSLAEDVYKSKVNVEGSSSVLPFTADPKADEIGDISGGSHGNVVSRSSEVISNSDDKVLEKPPTGISLSGSSGMPGKISAESASVSRDDTSHSSREQCKEAEEEEGGSADNSARTQIRFGHQRDAVINWLHGPYTPGLAGTYRRTEADTAVNVITDGATLAQALADKASPIAVSPGGFPFLIPETLPGHQDAILIGRFDTLLSRSMPNRTVSENESPVHVMWCSILAYRNPREEFPACVYVTTQYVQILRVLSLTGDNSVPKLEHYFHIPLPNIERLVIGYKGLYMHLEEAFVGPSGAFTLLTLNENKTNLFVDSVKLAYRRSTSDLDDYEDPNILTTDPQTEQILKHILNEFECLPDPSQISIQLYMLVVCDCNTRVHTRALVLTSRYIYIVCQDFTNLPPPSFVYEVLSNANLFSVSSIFPVKGRIENMILYDDLTIVQDSLTLGSVAASERKLKQKPASSFVGYGVKIQFNLGRDGVQALDFRVPTSNLREKFLTALTGGHSRITSPESVDSIRQRKNSKSSSGRKHKDGNHATRRLKYKSDSQVGHADVRKAVGTEGRGSMSSGSGCDINSDQLYKHRQRSHASIPSSKSHDTFLCRNSEALSDKKSAIIPSIPDIKVESSSIVADLKPDASVDNSLKDAVSDQPLHGLEGSIGVKCSQVGDISGTSDVISSLNNTVDEASPVMSLSSRLDTDSASESRQTSSDSHILHSESKTDNILSECKTDILSESKTLFESVSQADPGEVSIRVDSVDTSNVEISEDNLLSLNPSQPRDNESSQPGGNESSQPGGNESSQPGGNESSGVGSDQGIADTKISTFEKSERNAEATPESSDCSRAPGGKESDGEVEIKTGSNITERSDEGNQNISTVLISRSDKTLDFSTATYPSSRLLQHMEACRGLQTPVQADQSVAMTVLYSMTALEITNFFHTNVVPPSANNEELRHIMWTGLVLYEKPRTEIPAFTMLSNRAMYFITGRTDDEESSGSGQMEPRVTSVGSADLSNATGSQSDVSQLLQGTAIVSHVVLLSELKVVNIGCGKQTLRIVTSNGRVLACIIRDADLTEDFVGILEALLKSQFIGSPSPAQDIDDDDIYKKFSTCDPIDAHTYRLSLSWVSIVYPSSEAVADLLFLIHSHAQLGSKSVGYASILEGSPLQGRAAITKGSGNSVHKHNMKAAQKVSEDFSKDSVTFYLICFVNIRGSAKAGVGGASGNVRLREVSEVRDDVLCDNDPSTACSLIVTNHHLCLAIEDHVNYPIPDFARAPPSLPCTVVLMVRKLSRLVEVQLHARLKNIVILVFAEESVDIVVDASVDHFSKTDEGGRDLTDDCRNMELMVWVRNPRHRQALLQAIEQQWTELHGKQKLPVRSIS